MTIQRLEPHKARRTLGVYPAPDGNVAQQLQVLQDQATEWIGRVRASPLTPQEKRMAFRAGIRAKLLYPLVSQRCT